MGLLLSKRRELHLVLMQSSLVTVAILLCTSFASAQDAPEIARSSGVVGGVVVFWPRVVPSAEGASSSELAEAVQARLHALVARTLPGTPIDLRPEPERGCPRAGCVAMTVGVLIARHQSACVVVALVSGPGQSATQLVPWVGDVTVNRSAVPFREPPESSMTITDFAVCDDVVAQLSGREGAVAAVISAVSAGE